MITIKAPIRRTHKVTLVAIITLALYAPAKDVIDIISKHFSKQTIQIVDASFGTNMPWQEESASFLKVSNNAQSTLSRSQVIYTKLRLSNPTAEVKTYRKIWLNFTHENGDQEYTTDYTLYNTETRQRLIGQSIELGPNSSIDVIAAYRFIPSYKNKSPVTMSISWEGQSLLRDKACEYNLYNVSNTRFHYQCD
ncbi:hypothetical protein ACMUMQ_11000 [Marinomonas sp. 2405UD66-6]|uniref:hypothetical protein n=1 Tax=Marinomonas sp. 2405UD66-6 TaxID=3391834 RepID=UPI0039C96BEA